MDRKYEKHRNRNCGFTLVEIVVVLVVLSTLAVIMTPTMNRFIDEANKRKLSAACRACVTAAATLSVEEYATAQRGSRDLLVPPSDAEIRELAEIDTGSVALVSITQPAGRRIGSNIYSNPKYPPGSVEYLTYTDNKGHFVTYVRDYVINGSSSSHIIFSELKTWSKGAAFIQGEIIQGIPVGAEKRSDGSDNVMLFRCMKTHKSGSRSNTRDPKVKSNKGTWEVIGSTDGRPPAYSPTVRFGIGCVVEYNNNLYYRTDYNLTGGQTPYSKSSSAYWTLIGPASP